jgi:molybdopterin synthase sulfur carrier subunit
MRVTLLYFASVREAIGTGEEVRDLPDAVSTPRSLMAWLATLGEGYALAFSRPEKLRCAIDQAMAAPDALLGEAKEIAFFPPVTGG